MKQQSKLGGEFSNPHVLTLNTLHVSEDMLGCSSMEDRQAS